MTPQAVLRRRRQYSGMASLRSAASGVILPPQKRKLSKPARTPSPSRPSHTTQQKLVPSFKQAKKPVHFVGARVWQACEVPHPGSYCHPKTKTFKACTNAQSVTPLAQHHPKKLAPQLQAGKKKTCALRRRTGLAGCISPHAWIRSPREAVLGIRCSHQSKLWRVPARKGSVCAAGEP